MTVQSYDPAKFVRDVETLLIDHGLRPVRVGDPNATVAAGMLLRALDITPGIDGFEAAAQSVDKVWSDWDEGLSPGEPGQ